MATPIKNVDYELIRKAQEIEQYIKASWCKDFKTVELMIEKGIGYKAIAEALSNKYNEKISVNKLASNYRKYHLKNKQAKKKGS